LDRTFAAFVDANGHAHGSGPQNSYQKMMRTFVGASAPAASLVLADVSRQGVLSLTTTGRADRVRLRRLASGSVEVRINGRVYVAGEGVREIHLHTRGDRRDRIRVLGDLGAVRLRVNPDADGEVSTPTKVDGAASDFWAGLAEERQSGCSCPLCTGRL
jgi:hypothetical protein